jgi:hypothetical protein
MVILNPYFLEYFKDYNYFKNIINNIKNIRLSKNQESYLLYFVLHPHYSAYDIKFNKKKEGEKGGVTFDTSYRQIKNILNNLCKLKLIAHDKEKNPHNKKSYFLTDKGLFYIIKSPIFLHIDIQDMIRNYHGFKIFKDLLYPFINLNTLCSENIPRDILNSIFLYIQQYCSNIENFVSFVKNKNNWDEISWNWNTEKLRKYLIDKYKYKYKWLENSEDKEDNEQTNLIFFNKNKYSQSINIRLRFKGEKPYGYLISGTKRKKKEIPIPNIETFLIKFHLSKEESIGRSFSNYYTLRGSKFLFSLLSASTEYTFDISFLFSKDENFIRTLEAAKEDFVNFYLSIKNPYQYSLEALIRKDLWELAYKRNINDNDSLDR